VTETYLKELVISNLALIDQLEVPLESGLNVITGPTGSGKTMLIQALKLAFGQRADYELLSEQDDARVEVKVETSGSGPISFGERLADEFRFERQLRQDHTSPAHLNGERVRLKTLRENRTDLIDFHGQHDNQAVFESDFPRRVLDRFGDYDDELAEYRENYSRFSDLEDELEALQGSQSELQQRRDLLEYQLSELEEFDLSKIGWEEIEERRVKLESAEEIESTLNNSIDLIQGNQSLSDNLDRLQNNLQELQEFESELSDWVDEIASAGVMVEELRRELNELRESVTGFAHEYEDIMDRRSRWLELSRKHDVPPEQLHQQYQDLKAEKDNLEHREERKSELTDELEKIEDKLYLISDKLHKKRVNVAEELESKIVDILSHLNLANAIFEIQITEDGLGPHGYDRVEWLFASHDSQPVGPLSTRVSGGEISRVLLAIKAALAGADETAVLVFDEIDTGISGEEANRVGDVLKSLSEHHQVLCITHLPLVASRADNHIRVRRNDTEDNVVVEADKLDRSSKIDELSRLLSGEESSSVSREQAVELLE
jgi:DNA repair protein RecN (Recombination protein N)